jgi:tellurite resistance protein
VITPMLLAAEGIAPHALLAGRIVVDTFLVLTVMLGGWFTGQWMHGQLDIDRLHPGYFLPTVAGGFVAALGAALVGQHRLAEVMLGLGLVCWMILGSMILARLLFRPALPAALLPTLAIEVAPAAVATVAYLAIDGDRIDIVAAGLAGYGLLMVLAQFPLLPQYLKLRFGSSTWAFSFGWAAVATATLNWIELGRPSGHQVYAYLDLAAITLLIGAIAARTVVALSRRQLLPAPAVTPPIQAPPVGGPSTMATTTTVDSR